MNSIEEQLRAIDDELKKLEIRKQELLLRKSNVRNQTPTSHEQLSAKELFAGRGDVFTLKWENQNTGKSGYSPACHNEWQKGICNKPKIKCTDCKHQNFKGLSSQEAYSHLIGALRVMLRMFKFVPDKFVATLDHHGSLTTDPHSGQQSHTFQAQKN